MNKYFSFMTLGQSSETLNNCFIWHSPVGWLLCWKESLPMLSYCYFACLLSPYVSLTEDGSYSALFSIFQISLSHSSSIECHGFLLWHYMALELCSLNFTVFTSSLPFNSQPFPFISVAYMSVITLFMLSNFQIQSWSGVGQSDGQF